MDPSLKPIRSLREDDPAVEEALDAFILHLGERVDALQDAVLAGDDALLLEHAAGFRTEAERLGYPPLCEVLDAAREAVAGHDAEGARKAVADLTELVQRVRRGHRSAA